MSLVRFDPKSDVRVQTDKIITSTWSDNTNNLQSVYTSSQQTFSSATSSAQFYLNVYHNSTDPSFYTLTGTTMTLVGGAPPVGSNLVVRYLPLVG